MKTRLVTFGAVALAVAVGALAADKGTPAEAKAMLDKAVAKVEEHIADALAKGGKVAISNRSGQVVVSGWDRDVVQASATGDNGPVPVETQTSGDPSRPRLLLMVSSRRAGREAKLDVKVPRYADVETLEG